MRKQTKAHAQSIYHTLPRSRQLDKVRASARSAMDLFIVCIDNTRAIISIIDADSCPFPCSPLVPIDGLTLGPGSPRWQDRRWLFSEHSSMWWIMLDYLKENVTSIRHGLSTQCPADFDTRIDRHARLGISLATGRHRSGVQRSIGWSWKSAFHLENKAKINCDRMTSRLILPVEKSCKVACCWGILEFPPPPPR